MSTPENDANLGDLMETPLVLLESNSEGSFELNQRTVELLHRLDTPVVVVGVAGIYRSGKSYLMNLLAGKKTGFALGSTVQSMTKGIWIWCRPHPSIPNTTLILMDTEGLEDVDDGDDNKDMQIIVLTLLLSSTFIYNTCGRVDNSLVKQLGFVSELTKFIQVRTGEPSSDLDFDLYFPVLVVTVRDFVLELEISGKPVTAKEYFEYCLKLKEAPKKASSSRKIDEYNEPRIKIRKYFPESKRHCFVLPQPVKNFTQENLKRLAELPVEDMNPDFLVKSRMYSRLIMDISHNKSFGQFDRVNGRMFADMAATYVTALLSGEMPCIQSALRLTAIQENRRIVEECLKQYEIEVFKVEFPVTQEELINVHNETVEKLTNEFKKRIIFEEAEEFQKEFEKNFQSSYKILENINVEASREKCENLLETLNEAINTKYGNRVYLCPGGYDVYMRDLEALKSQYHAAPKKGVTSDKILNEFLHKKKSEIDNIIAIDKEMSMSKIREEAERALREEVERRETELKEEMKAAAIRDIELRKSLQETNEKLQQEFAQRLREQQEKHERMLAERQENQDRIQQEMNKKIQDLQQELRNRQKQGGSGGGGCIIL